MDATANGRPVKTGYNGDHDTGKDGNLWDDLETDRDNDNNSNGGNTNNGGSSTTDQEQNQQDTDTSGNDGQMDAATRAKIT